MARVLQNAGIKHSRRDSILTITAPNSSARGHVAKVLMMGLMPVERKLVQLGGGHLSHLFGGPDVDQYVKIVESEWFDRAMAADEFSIYFQPIVDLKANRTFAYECLIRLEGDKLHNGAEIVEAASIRGQVLEFDSYARVKAVETATKQHLPNTELFVNFFPSAVYDPGPCLESMIEAVSRSGYRPQDIVFEILECDQITNVDHTRSICQYFRQKGFRYALDDLGVGTNGVDMIEILEPDYVKIDKSIIWNLSQPAQRSLLDRAVSAAANVQAAVIAEGIESPQMATTVKNLGVHMMQGYFFGKPNPVMRDEMNLSGAADLRTLAQVMKIPQGIAEPAGEPTSSSQLELVPVSSASSRRTPS
ncbi:MAG: EAL domain-containing protein [Acidobacteria bacterium]|nr:EAL domain-containing protein [Acidobacteriota bacterium]